MGAIVTHSRLVSALVFDEGRVWKKKVSAACTQSPKS
jgi:hypothetical protein